MRIFLRRSIYCMWFEKGIMGKKGEKYKPNALFKTQYLLVDNYIA
jgi:hypothetical protein